MNDPALQAPAGPATPLAAIGGNRHDRRAARAAARTGSSVKDFAARNNLGLTKVYAEIGAGRLIAHKVGSRTIIFDDDEAAWRALASQARAATGRRPEVLHLPTQHAVGRRSRKGWRTVSSGPPANQG